MGTSPLLDTETDEAAMDRYLFSFRTSELFLIGKSKNGHSGTEYKQL